MKGGAVRAGICSMLAAPPALAQAPPTVGGGAPASPPDVAAQLAYSAPAGCPSERLLRAIVASRMGFDPLEPRSPAPDLRLRVTIVRKNGGFSVTLDLRDGTGQVLWVRPPLAMNDCGQLVEIIGGVTIPGIPRLADPPAPASAPAPARPPAPVPPPPAPPLPVASPPPPPRPPSTFPRPSFRLGFRAAAAIGVAPAPTGAFSIEAGAGWEHVSVAVEGRADVPVTGGGLLGTRVTTSIQAASLVPCGHWRWFVGCVVVSAGTFQGASPTQQFSVEHFNRYTTGGLRTGIEWPSRSTFALRVSADVLANAPPYFVSVNGVHLWQAGTFAFLGGVGVVGRFGGP